MGRKKTRLTDVRLEALRRQIERWRGTRTKRSPMPESLWQVAAALAREHGVYAAAQELGLSYGSLRTRAEADEPGRARAKGAGLARATFVELGAGPIGAAPMPGAHPPEGAFAFLAGSTRISRRLANSNMPSSESSRP